MHNRRWLSCAALVAAPALALSACGATKKTVASPASTTLPTTPSAARTIVQAAAYDAQLSTLATALNLAGMNAELSHSGPFTIFAPDNAAFAALPHRRLAALLSPSGKQELVKILRHHVVPQRLAPGKLKSGLVRTLGNEALTLTVKGSSVEIVDQHGEKTRVTGAVVVGTNGVIYTVDRLLISP